MTSDGNKALGHSQADAAYTSIRRAIIACELRPGEQVSEPALVERFDFGRAAIRTALTRLSHEQLVQALPRRGYVIAPITIKQVHDLFGLRLILEPAAARLAARHADQHLISDLDRLNQLYARAVDSQGSTEVLRQTNTDFHLAVAHASGNHRLVELLEGLLDEVERVLYLPLPRTTVSERTIFSVAEHQRIIDALSARDEQEAERTAIDHILLHRQAVIDKLISSPQLRSVNLVGVPDGA